MHKKYNFISGLPRSGSTLLSSILKQNPRFTAGISDPLFGFCKSIINELNQTVGMRSLVDTEKTKDLLLGLFDNYYKNDNEVCFNTNRSWTANTNILKDLFPNFKMLVCVREIPWILDSFERLNSKNPYTIKPIYNHIDLQNVYQRTHMLMGNIPNQFGYVSSPLENLKQAVNCQEIGQICFIDYNSLTKRPLETMKMVYDFLEEPWFEHDFDDVEDSYDEYDEQTKIHGLHKIRKKIEFIERNTIIPIDLWNNYAPQSFWLNEDFKHSKSTLNWINLVDDVSFKHNIKRHINKQL